MTTATLKESNGTTGTLVTAGYGEVYRKHIPGPGTYVVRTCRPAAVGYEFPKGRVTVTQANLDEAASRGHVDLEVAY